MKPSVEDSSNNQHEILQTREKNSELELEITKLEEELEEKENSK